MTPEGTAGGTAEAKADKSSASRRASCATGCRSRCPTGMGPESCTSVGTCRSRSFRDTPGGLRTGAAGIGSGRMSRRASTRLPRGTGKRFRRQSHTTLPLGNRRAPHTRVCRFRRRSRTPRPRRESPKQLFQTLEPSRLSLLEGSLPEKRSRQRHSGGAEHPDGAGHGLRLDDHDPAGYYAGTTRTRSGFSGLRSGHPDARFSR